MGEATQKKAVKTISIMAVIIFVAKFAGLLRETMIAAVYGKGEAADIINTSTQIPLLFFDMTLGVAILSTFVPVFNKRLEREGRERAMDFANNFITIVTLIAGAAALLGMIFSNPIVHIMAPGYDAAKVAQTGALLKILFPSIIFTTMAYVSVGFLQSFGEFTVPSLISLVSNMVMILYLAVFGNRYGLQGVIISMLIAWSLQFFIQIPSLAKKGFRYRFTLNFKDSGIKDAAKLALPVLISSWVNPICSIINMRFGSEMGDGIVSGLNWSYKIYIIMVGVFAYAITNFIFPKLSRLSASDDDGSGFAEATRVSIGWVVFIIGFVSALFLALANPIIKVVFEHGSFNASDASITGEALFFYSFGMVGYAMCEVLNKSFYAIEDGKTPMLSSIFGILVNFAAALLLVRVFNMQIGGLALASAISSVAIAAMLVIMINKRKPGVVTPHFIFNIVKTLIGAAAAFAAAKLIYIRVDELFANTFLLLLLKLCIASAPALVIYLITTFILKTDECASMRKFFGRGAR